MKMIEIGAIVWGVQDIARAVQFWSAALHYKLKGAPSADWAILIPVEGDGVQISLSKVSSPKARRHHIDLFTDDQEAEVKRLIGSAQRERNGCTRPKRITWSCRTRTGTRSASCNVDETAAVPRTAEETGRGESERPGSRYTRMSRSV